MGCKSMKIVFVVRKIRHKLCMIYAFLIFGTRVYPIGSMVIAFVRQLVRPSVSFSLNISETAHWFFLIFCMKLGHRKGTKLTDPDF